MAQTSYRVYDTAYPYFVTIGVLGWLPILGLQGVPDILLKSLHFLQSKREASLYAYVIMKDHMHFIIQTEELSKKMRAYKSYTARQIIDYLKENRQSSYLPKLKLMKSSSNTDSEYQLWQEGFHPKQIIGDAMALQKIEYIHQNPVKRGYVDEPEDWKYSSARDYIGRKGLIPVTLFEK